MEERGRERRIYSPQGYGRGKKVEETRRRAEEDGRDEAERKGGRNGEGKNGETRTKGASPGWRCTSSGHWHETVHFYRGREGWESSGFNGRTLPLPLTRRNLLCQASFVRSFVRSFPSTRRVLVLFSTTCIRREQRFLRKNRCSNRCFLREGGKEGRLA